MNGTDKKVLAHYEKNLKLAIQAAEIYKSTGDTQLAKNYVLKISTSAENCAYCKRYDCINKITCPIAIYVGDTRCRRTGWTQMSHALTSALHSGPWCLDDLIIEINKFLGFLKRVIDAK